MSFPKSKVLVTIKCQQEKFIGKHGHIWHRNFELGQAWASV